MKKNLFLVTAIAAPILCFALAGFSGIYNFGFSETKVLSADCVQCKAENGCRVCKGGGDANSCMTGPDCEACVEIGICQSGSGFADESCNKADLTRSSKGLIKLPVETIREIAAVHPRFAASLAQLNAAGFSKGPYRISWTPLEMNVADVERYLNPKIRSRDILSGRKAEAIRINQLIERGLEKDIVYRITVEELDFSTKLIKLQVQSGFGGDPSYSLLEVRYLSAGNQASLADGSATEAKIEWQIN